MFHLAAAVDFENDWHRFRQVNMEGTRHVVAAARSAGVRRLIHTSSIVAVGANRHPRVLDETATWDLNTLRVPYVTTKRLAEEWVLSASGRDLEVVVVNPASVVGPDDFSASEFVFSGIIRVAVSREGRNRSKDRPLQGFAWRNRSTTSS